jgi:hypothetical protein
MFTSYLGVEETMTSRYAVINASTLVTDDDVYTMWDAAKCQLYWQASKAWERSFMDSVFVPKNGTAPADCYPIYVLDNPDVASALGYHTEDPGGKVYGRVFAEPVLQNGGTVLQGPLTISSVLSHEVLELFVDRHCQLWADRGDGTMVAYEVGDPVESDTYQVHAQNQHGTTTLVNVSNFALDAWFDMQATAPGTRYDWMKQCTAPLQMTKGGYGVVLNTSMGATTQVFGSKEAETLHNLIKPYHPGARSARRVANTVLPDVKPQGWWATFFGR